MDGKKKKNKKKKGNSLSKATDGAPTSVDEVAVPERDNGSVSKLNHIPQVPSTSDVQSVGVSESDIELDRHKLYEERFVKLHEEVSQLEDEKNQWLQKEASLEEKIKLLQIDVDSCIENKAGLEDKLKSLQGGNDLLLQKEAILEDRVKHIEGIKDSWILKETLIDEMSSRLDEVNLRLDAQVKELRESKDDLVQENTQLKESIAALESRVQHMETESLLSRSPTVMITEQTTAEKIPQYQPEAAPLPLVEKLEPEKTELIEKVKEVHIESDQHSMAADHYSSTTELDHIRGPPESAIPIDYTPQYSNEMYEPGDTVASVAADHYSSTIELDHIKGPPESAIPIDYNYTTEYSNEMYESGDTIASLARARNPFGIPNGVEDFSSLNRVRGGQALGMDNPRISEDIVSVPLDDIHVQEVEPQTAEEEEPALPLSDAPLIGAPFRLISFFAKYVSGADLVEQESARSG